MARQSERTQYIKYVTTLVTEEKGTLVGKPDQHPAQLVTEHYGAEAGLLPWHRDGFEHLIVLPATETVDRLFNGRPLHIVQTQRVLDYVVSLSQEVAH